MSKASLIAKYILGLIYFIFGLNGFLNFIPAPPPPESLMPFFNGMMSLGYFFPFLKATEVVCGALLLTGFFVPLALVIAAPITLQILLLHGFMTPGLENQILPVVMVILHVLAARGYWDKFTPLLKAK